MIPGACLAGQDLQHTTLGEWKRGGYLDGLGHVLAFQDIAQQRAFSVQERSLGRLQLVLPDPDRYRFGVGGEGVAAPVRYRSTALAWCPPSPSAGAGLDCRRAPAMALPRVLATGGGKAFPTWR